MSTPENEAGAILEIEAPKARLADHAHTAIVLVAFLATLIVKAIEPGAVSDELIYGLGGGVLGTAGTSGLRR